MKVDVDVVHNVHQVHLLNKMTETPPPILKTWRRLYAAVLSALVAEVLLFYILTRSFH